MKTARAALAAICAAGLACSSGSDGRTGPTVSGRVVYENGLPVPGIKVNVAGAQATTAADGSFTFSNVTLPYDLVVGPDPDWSPLGLGHPWTHLYLGLTRTDPAIRIPDETFGTATITGTVSGGLTRGLLLPPYDLPPYVFFCAAGRCTSATWSSGTYTIDASIMDPDGTSTGTLLAWGYMPDGAGRFVETDAFEVTVGDTLTRDLTPDSALEMTTIDGTLSEPDSGNGSLELYGWLELRETSPAGGEIILMSGEATPGTFSFTLPAFPGHSFSLVGAHETFGRNVRAYDARRSLAAGSTVALTPGVLPRTTTPTAPITVDSAVSWSADADDVAHVSIRCWASDRAANVDVYVAADALPLGDVFRSSLPSAMTCGWDVDLHEHTTLDTYTSPEWTGAGRYRWAEGYFFELP